MLKGIFTAENFAIITSNVEIDSLQWQKYFQDNWNQIIRTNTKVLVLAGIHGGKDGRVGSVDVGLFEEYERQIKFLMKKYKEDLEMKRAEFVLENMGSHMDENKHEINKETFIKAVKKHSPTVITLAFCYTNVSVLNDVLRLSGIYTFIIMSKNRANITEDKCVKLDPVQKQIIKKVSKIQPKNIFLWGSSGSGKTILLTEILKMKMSYYNKKSVKLNVFVTSYMATSESQLMFDFRDKYLPFLPSESQVEFIPFNSLCQGKIEIM